MPHIKKNEIFYLKELKERLKGTKKYIDDVGKLSDMITRLEAEQEKINERTRTIIREKRKINPNYGQTKHKKKHLLGG